MNIVRVEKGYAPVKPVTICLDTKSSPYIETNKYPTICR